jgi:Xaa-Pro aminopeptidase
VTDDHARRLAAAGAAAASAGVDALLLTPGANLRYLVGYDATPLERLTCLVVPARAEPTLVVPRLERRAALDSPAGELGIDVTAFGETEDAYAVVAGLLGADVRRVAVDNHMWAEKAFGFAAALPQCEQVLAGGILRELRMRKTPAEVAALREAGEAIVKWPATSARPSSPRATPASCSSSWAPGPTRRRRITRCPTG